MDTYPHPDARRILDAEIRRHIADTIGATVVVGFADILDASDAMLGGARGAGYMHPQDPREWYLSLGARRGLTWHTAPVPRTPLDTIAFVLSVGFGNGSPLPQPSGRWDIFVNDRLAVSVRVVKHSQLWRGADCRLAFAANRIESAAPFASLCLNSVITAESFATFGPALLTVPAAWVTPGAPATLRVEARSDVPSTRWFQLAANSSDIIHSSDIYRAVELLTPAGLPQIGGQRVYFGDIHTHSGQVQESADNSGCGIGSWRDNYHWARGAGGLDFYALTDHEYQIGPRLVDHYLGLADEYNEDGRFVCLPGFEFTSLLYGHRNVYFKDAGGTVVSAVRDWGPTFSVFAHPETALSPRELFAELERTGVPFFAVPHHPSAAPHPFNWGLCHPQHDRLVEVYSCWGSSEYYGDFPRGVADRYRTLDVRDALDRGYRLGLIASSDGHDGHPGDAQSPGVKHHHTFHHLGSGLAAVLSPGLSRAAVFDALYARRCYATTGVPILLSFEINGLGMGSVSPALPEGASPLLRVSCRGANGIDHLRIIRNGRVVHTVPCHGEFVCETEWQDQGYCASLPTYYYVRAVQIDRESAWSSPIWLQ